MRKLDREDFDAFLVFATMFIILAWVLLFLSSCSYVPPRIHLTPGPSIVYADNGDTLTVSEGWVAERYHSWRQFMSKRMAQGRLVMLCVETRGTGVWRVRKSQLWEE